jgi:Glycosyl transferase family 2
MSESVSCAEGMCSEASARARVPARAFPIAVIIPAYNRAEMLRRSLASAFAQEPAPPDQVIVVDDGSRDDTAAVAEEMGASVIRHPRNLGLSAARNTGLRAARHEWVALLDSDDEWLSHHLAGLWTLRAEHVLVTGSSLHCGADPAADRFAGPVTRSPLVLRTGEQLVYPSNIIPVSASMFRRQLALEAGGFRAHEGVVEDFDMWLRLLERGTGICSPRVSVIYHVHDGQMSRQDVHTMHSAHAQAAAAHLERVGGSRVPLQRHEAVVAWDNLREALRAHRRRQAASCARFLLARPQRVIGLIGLLGRRYRVRRRSVALRRAGVGRGVVATPDA